MKPLCSSIKHLLPSKNIVEKWITIMKRFTFIERLLNSFHINAPFLYALKTLAIEMEHWHKMVKLKLKILNEIIWNETLSKKFNSGMHFQEGLQEIIWILQLKMIFIIFLFSRNMYLLPLIFFSKTL